METLLYLVPLLALLVPLLRGHFIGESTIARMRERAADRELRPRPARTIGTPHGAPSILPRGGRLIASSLAVRPPPATLLT